MKMCRRFYRVAADLHLRGEHVGRARRQDGQRHARPCDALQRLVDGPVPAGNNHQVGPAIHLLACNGRRRARTGSRRRRKIVPRVPQRFFGAPDERLARTEDASGTRVIDQGAAFVRIDN